MVKIAVRLDDITPDMDWERFQAVKALLDRHGIRPLAGVVPDNRDRMLDAGTDAQPCSPEEGWQRICGLQKEGWVLAMHGYQHLYTTKKGGCFPLNRFSEFAGLPYETQRTMLEEGKRLLARRGIEPRIFMAPAHSYDRSTLRALKETGFTALTDGFGSRPYRWKGLTFYPISFHLRHTLRKKNGFSTLVIHPATVSDSDLKRLETYFTAPGAEWISYTSYLQQEPVRAGLFSRCREYVMATVKSLLGLCMQKLR